MPTHAKIAAPSQYEAERRFRDLLEQGDIDALCDLLGEKYNTFVKQINPNNRDSKSDFHKTARLLWGVRNVCGDDAAWDAINLLVELVFPGEGKMQLITRIESDLQKLKKDVSAEAMQGATVTEMKRARA